MVKSTTGTMCPLLCSYFSLCCSSFDLASIHDHYEMNKIISLMKSNYARFRTYTYWFGLNDRSREGGYMYVEKVKCAFTIFTSCSEVRLIHHVICALQMLYLVTNGDCACIQTQMISLVMQATANDQ